MDFDEIENFLALEREKRKTERERELEKMLNENAQKYGKMLVEAQAPIFKELAEIEARKPPMPIIIDGKIYEWRCALNITGSL